MQTDQTTLDFLGSNISETMPANLVPITASPSMDVYVVREAMWRQVVKDMASQYGVLGQPTKDAMFVDRGDLVFTDRRISSTDEYSLSGSSMPIVFNTMLGLSFFLQDENDQRYTLMHNSSLSGTNIWAGGPSTPVTPREDAERYLTRMLQERYHDIRLAGVALSKWTIGDQRQSNAGIAVATSGTISLLNTTGKHVRIGQLLCLRMPEWGDQFALKSTNRLYDDGSLPVGGAMSMVDVGLSGSVLNKIGRPILQIYTTSGQSLAASRQSTATAAAAAQSIIRQAIAEVRREVGRAGTEFGQRMALVRDGVRVGMLSNWMGVPPPPPEDRQQYVDTSVVGSDAETQFEIFRDSNLSRIDNIIVELSAKGLSPASLHDAYICVMTEILRIHDAVWRAIPEASPGEEPAFFDTPVPVPLGEPPNPTPAQAQRFTDYDQAIRRELVHLRSFHAIEAVQRGSFFETLAGNNATATLRIREAAQAEQALAANQVDAVSYRAVYANATQVLSHIRELNATLAVFATAGRNNVYARTTRYSVVIGVLANVLSESRRVLDESNAILVVADADAIQISDDATALIGGVPFVGGVPRLNLADNLRTIIEDNDNARRRADIATAALPAYNPRLAEIGRLRALGDAANVAVGRLRLVQQQRTAATVASTIVDVPAADNAQIARMAAGTPAQRQTAIIKALLGIPPAAPPGDIANWRSKIRAEHKPMFDRELARIREAANEHLRERIRPWDERLRQTILRIGGLIRDLRHPFADTTHARLLFGNQSPESFVSDSDQLREFTALTLPQLDFTADLEASFYFNPRISLQRSRRTFRSVIQTLPGPVIAPLTSTSDLFSDPTDNSNTAAIAANIGTCMRLYMIYNDSLIDGLPVAADFRVHFADGGGHAVLVAPSDNTSTTVDHAAGRWYEKPMFKVVEGADPNFLMRVTMIA